MKRLQRLIIIAFVALTTPGYAQEKEAQKDTISFFRGKGKLILKEKNGEKNALSFTIGTRNVDSVRKTVELSYGSFDLGFSNYQDRSTYGYLFIAPPETNSLDHFTASMSPRAMKEDFELRTGKSIHLNFGLVKAQVSLYKHYLSFVTGLTYDINSLSYRNPIKWHNQPLIDSSSNTPFTSDTYVSRENVRFKKNKLITNYLQVPLLLRIETSPHNPKRNVFISGGTFLGYLVRVHTKQIVQNTTEKIKQFDDFNITKFQYGAQFELGYRGTTLYVKRNFTPLTEYGTRQYPYCFGVRLSGL